MQVCGLLQSTAAIANNIVQNVDEIFSILNILTRTMRLLTGSDHHLSQFLYKKNSPLTKDLTEGDGEKETACGQWRSRGRPNGVTSLCSAPQTPAASGCKTPPALATWRPQSPRSHRRTQDFRPRPTSRGRANLSIGRRRH